MNTGTKTKFDFKKKLKIATPKNYRVTLENNNLTAFEAVCDVLHSIYNLSKEQAYSIMMEAHANGIAQVIVSSKEICEQKLDQTREFLNSKINETFDGRDAYYGLLVFNLEEMPS